MIKLEARNCRVWSTCAVCSAYDCWMLVLMHTPCLGATLIWHLPTECSSSVTTYIHYLWISMMSKPGASNQTHLVNCGYISNSASYVRGIFALVRVAEFCLNVIFVIFLSNARKTVPLWLECPNSNSILWFRSTPNWKDLMGCHCHVGLSSNLFPVLLLTERSESVTGRVPVHHVLGNFESRVSYIYATSHSVVPSCIWAILVFKMRCSFKHNRVISIFVVLLCLRKLFRCKKHEQS